MVKRPPKFGLQGKPKETRSSEDNVQVQVNGGLPPQVDGQIRCFCKLSISQVVWTVLKPPQLALVRVKWWGEEGNGVLFRPFDVKKGNRSGCRTTARYPVRSGPCQFATYLNDMGSLMLDLLTGPNSEVIGQASISQIGQLTNTKPVNGFFPVLSSSGQKLANLQVSIVLEPLIASYDQSGSIPTTDAAGDVRRHQESLLEPASFHPKPHSDLPSQPENTVFISPTSNKERLKEQSRSQGTRFGADMRQQLNYGLPNGSTSPSHGNHSSAVAITMNGDVVSLANGTVGNADLGASGGFAYHGDLNNSSNMANRAGSPKRAADSGGADLLSVLVDRGNKLREAMIVSSLHSDQNVAGSQLNAAGSSNLLKSPPKSGFAPGAVNLAMSPAGSGPAKSAVDFLLGSPVRNQDFQLYQLMNGLSPGTSLSSDVGHDLLLSEAEDPMHDNSLLQELFYHNSDFEGMGINDISGLEPSALTAPHLSLPARLPGSNGLHHPLTEPGNQRPLSRTSSLTSLQLLEQDQEAAEGKKKTKRKARSRSGSRSRSRSRSNSQTRSRSNTPRKHTSKVLKPEVKESAANAGGKENIPGRTKDTSKLSSKPRRKMRSRSTSRSRSRSRSGRRKVSVDEGSDSDRMSTARSESSRVSFDPVPSDMNNPKSEGLSVERLTLLGRVHVARVNVELLDVLRPDNLDTSDSKLSVSKLRGGRPPRPLKSKKPCTYFVEYQFPVTSVSRDKYTANAMATEVTRVASKNIKNGSVLFNHRTVFPIMFDGTVVEKWWKAALVFRVYCREAGQNSPTLIGSGGMSLKSILRSENLCVQRQIEVPDTRKNGLLNSSRSTSFNSSMTGRSNTHLFGHLKVSVELGSDHREFATVMARTKLAEMSGNVKVVPIGRPSSEQARLVEQLNQNKDQPVVKSPVKKIDLPSASGGGGVAVTGLPPQSPRRRAADLKAGEEEGAGDEISRLKQQLKVTLAALGSEGDHREVASHLNSGATVGEKSAVEPSTLHTMLYIQEGRGFSVMGIPPLHMANRHPAVLQAQQAGRMEGRDNVTRNSYLVCRMFWCNDAVHSNVCWGTLDPEYNFLQVAPVLMTSSLLERMRDNYMIVEVWDKKVSSENDKLIGMVKLSLHQFYLSFRERKIANALLRSQYPVMAADNYMPIVDLFSGLHFGQLKVVLAMGSEEQISTLQRLALDSSGLEQVPQKPTSYLERQDLLNGAPTQASGSGVEHQFEVIIEGVRGLKLFESMIWGEADCFVQFFFPTQGESGQQEGPISIKSIPTMKCFRTATTLCVPDPTFHDSSRHKLMLPVGTPVQRELLTACANSGGGVSGLPFEVWCRYYTPNVRDQLIAKCTLPLAKLCAMITMHKRGEPCVQSFPLRLSHVGVDGQMEDAELAAKSRDAGLLDITVHYKSQTAQVDSNAPVSGRHHDGSQVCLSVGVLRASGLKAAADYLAELDPSMVYPADVGINAYVRIKITFLGKESERMTKTVARSFCPDFNHYLDFPCPLLMSSVLSADSTSLAELLESAEAVFEIWHQTPTGLYKDVQSEKALGEVSMRRLAQSSGDVLLGTSVVPLMSLLTRRTGLSGWFAVNLPNVGWARPTQGDQGLGTALDQVVGGLELSLRFAHQDDRDRVVGVARSVGWSPIDVEVEQPDWQDEDSHQRVHNLTVSVDQVSFPLSSAVLVGRSELEAGTRCYLRYKLYDKGAVVSKSRRVNVSEGGNLLCTLNHKHSFMLSHTAPLQWYLREERLEIQAWLTFGKGRAGEKKPRQRDKLIGSCYMDLESLTDMRRKQQRISGLFPVFKPGTSHLKGAFIKAQVTSRLSTNAKEQNSESDLTANPNDVSQSGSETDLSSDNAQLFGELGLNNKSPKKKRGRGKDPEASFSVLLAVERAMHLPLVTERNRSGEINPTTYISYQSAERSSPSCSSVFPNSANPVWDYAVETRLSTEYLHKENKNLVLKVWHKPSDAPKSPDKSSDRVLGFVSVDLSPLTKGLHQICGWYNIVDFTGQCRGQIKVSITPQETPRSLLPQSSPSSSLMMPMMPVPGLSFPTCTQAVASSIAEQLASLQQRVMERMGALTAGQDAGPTAGGAASGQELNRTGESSQKEDWEFSGTCQEVESEPAAPLHWQPKFINKPDLDDPSKSYLFSSLRRQLADLDTITQKLKTRLTLTPAAPDGDTSLNQVNSARSGDILTGTQSGLSTIHTASSLMTTHGSRYNNASSSEVATSQESARSRTANNSSLLEGEPLTVAGVSSDRAGNSSNNNSGNNVHQKLLDSGVFSAKNFSEKSAEDAPESHRSSDKNIELVGTTDDNMSTLPSALIRSLPVPPSAVNTLEAGFLAAAAAKTQTLLPTGDYSESSGNSHGFVPGTQRSTVTAGSMSVQDAGRMDGSKETSSGTGSKGTSKNSGSGSACSEKIAEESVRTRKEKQLYEEEDEDSDTEVEEEDKEVGSGRHYGSYHRYREMLDDEEDEDDVEEEGEADEDVVEVVPRSLNNMSTVLALTTAADAVAANNGEEPPPAAGSKIADNCEDVNTDVEGPRKDLEKLAFSPASPNVHEGTSLWCSEDNDSFFQQVFERNKQVLNESGDEAIEELTIDSWLQGQGERLAGHERLQTWLEAHGGSSAGEGTQGAGGRDTEEEEEEEEEEDEKDGAVVRGGESGRDQDEREKEEFQWKDGEMSSKQVCDEEGSCSRQGYDEEKMATTNGSRKLSGVDVRLHLNEDSDAESGEETLREGYKNDDVWQQMTARNSSDEETARDMWTTQRQQTVVTEFFDDEEQQPKSNNVPVYAHDDDNNGDDDHDEEEEEKEGNEREDEDAVLDMLPSFSPNAPVSLLSNVELVDSLNSTAHVNGWGSNLNTVESQFSENGNAGGEYPYTLVLADTRQASMRSRNGGGKGNGGARPKVKHLLSNVELDSNHSSQRPSSGSSLASRASATSQLSGEKAGSLRSLETDSFKPAGGSGGASVKSSSSHSSAAMATNVGHGSHAVLDQSNGNGAVNEESDRGMNVDELEELHQNDDRVVETNVNVNSSNAGRMTRKSRSHRSRKSRLHSDRDSTLDSAYVDGDYSDGHTTQPNSIIMVNGNSSGVSGGVCHMSTDELTPEDSGLGPAVTAGLNGEEEEPGAGLPNFFMPVEELQASIRALQMATSAAVNVSEEEVKSQNKAKVVSELVNKIAAPKAKATLASTKNKKPPSVEEAKRIAKIFSSKMS